MSPVIEDVEAPVILIVTDDHLDPFELHARFDDAGGGTDYVEDSLIGIPYQESSISDRDDFAVDILRIIYIMKGMLKIRLVLGS